MRGKKEGEKETRGGRGGKPEQHKIKMLEMKEEEKDTDRGRKVKQEEENKKDLDDLGYRRHRGGEKKDR